MRVLVSLPFSMKIKFDRKIEVSQFSLEIFVRSLSPNAQWANRAQFSADKEFQQQKWTTWNWTKRKNLWSMRSFLFSSSNDWRNKVSFKSNIISIHFYYWNRIHQWKSHRRPIAVTLFRKWTVIEFLKKSCQVQIFFLSKRKGNFLFG